MKNSFPLLRALSFAACIGISSPQVLAAEMPHIKLGNAELPQELKSDGNVVAALTWTDSTGKNFAVLSQTTTRGPEGESSSLHASGYRLDNGSVRSTWQVRDWIRDCDLDMTSFFEPASFEVTDLDGNGVAEVSFVYRMACNGGVDLVGEKLFLIENEKKFPIRGGTEPRGIGENGSRGYYDGPMKVDKAFNEAPGVFKSFAVSKWRKFRRPTGWSLN